MRDIIQRLERRVEQLETREQDEAAQPAHDTRALEYQEKDFENGRQLDGSRAALRQRQRRLVRRTAPTASRRTTPSRSGTRASSSRPSSDATCDWARPRWCATSASSSSGTWCASARFRTTSASSTWTSRASAIRTGRTSRSAASRSRSARTTCASARATPDNPFISNTVGGPWYWDEGLRGIRPHRQGRLGHLDQRRRDAVQLRSQHGQAVHAEALRRSDAVAAPLGERAALRGDGLGTSAAMGALWLGEIWARAFGAGTTVPNFIDGVIVADGPNRLKDSWLAGGDVILDFPDIARIWLGGGWYDIDSTGGEPLRPQSLLLDRGGRARGRGRCPGADALLCRRARERARHLRLERGLPARLPAVSDTRLQLEVARSLFDGARLAHHRRRHAARRIQPPRHRCGATA